MARVRVVMDPGADTQVARLETKVAHDMAEEVKNDAQRIVRGQSYRTGHLHDEIKVEDMGRGHSNVHADADYSAYVELGTSRMQAEPFLRPALYTRRSL